MLGTPYLVAAPRVLLAVKASFASALAWFLAPLVPFADDTYSYYAPLGVLVSAYPTIAGSLRSSEQALLGLAIGLGLGVAGVSALGEGSCSARTPRFPRCCCVA